MRERLRAARRACPRTGSIQPVSALQIKHLGGVEEVEDEAFVVEPTLDNQGDLGDRPAQLAMASARSWP